MSATLQTLGWSSNSSKTEFVKQPMRTTSRQRMDAYDRLPAEMRAFLRNAKVDWSQIEFLRCWLAGEPVQATLSRYAAAERNLKPMTAQLET